MSTKRSLIFIGTFFTSFPMSVCYAQGDTPGGLDVKLGIGAAFLILSFVGAMAFYNKKRSIQRNNKAPIAVADETELLTGVDDPAGNPCIRLRNLGTLEQVWDVSIAEDTVVGRDTSCKICLDEKSVSRRQCRIFASERTMVENLSTSNITELNGEKLKLPAALKIGDKLKCGRITLMVEAIYTSDSHNIGDLNKGTMYINI